MTYHIIHKHLRWGTSPKNFFVNGFRHRLLVAGGRVEDKLPMSQSKMKGNYHCHTERQEFSPGDQVLALMPNCRFSIPGQVHRSIYGN